MMRSAFLGAVLLLVTAGCGAYQFPGSSPAPSSADAKVSGRVLSVPCAPVEQAGSACAGRPVGGLELDYVQGTAKVRSAVTDSNGFYAVALPPGAYAVMLNTYMRLISGPTKLSLAAGSSVVANYVLDNGIRAPVPQQ